MVCLRNIFSYAVFGPPGRVRFSCATEVSIHTGGGSPIQGEQLWICR